ncbi:MAG: hypothetical protein WCA56_07285 [Xanthobacteraceae bacterium]
MSKPTGSEPREENVRVALFARQTATRIKALFESEQTKPSEDYEAEYRALTLDISRVLDPIFAMTEEREQQAALDDFATLLEGQLAIGIDLRRESVSVKRSRQRNLVYEGDSSSPDSLSSSILMVLRNAYSNPGTTNVVEIPSHEERLDAKFRFRTRLRKTRLVKEDRFNRLDPLGSRGQPNRNGAGEQTEGFLPDASDIRAAALALVQKVHPEWPSDQQALAAQNALEGVEAAGTGLSIAKILEQTDDSVDQHRRDKRRRIPDELDIAIEALAPALTEKDRDEIKVQALAPQKPPIPALGPKDLAAIKRRAEKRPWSGRPTHRYSAFLWVQENYEEWLPGLLQHHLKFDKSSLYDAFAKRVSREGGLPEWLDVPTEAEAELRNTPDPIKRAKILTLRRLARDHTRGVRAIKQHPAAPKI